MTHDMSQTAPAPFRHSDLRRPALRSTPADPHLHSAGSPAPAPCPQAAPLGSHTCTSPAPLTWQVHTLSPTLAPPPPPDLHRPAASPDQRGEVQQRQWEWCRKRFREQSRSRKWYRGAWMAWTTRIEV